MTLLGCAAGIHPLLELFVGIPMAITYLLQDLLKFEYTLIFPVFVPILTVCNLALFIPTLQLRKFKEPMHFMMTQGGIFVLYMIISFPIAGSFVYL